MGRAKSFLRGSFQLIKSVVYITIDNKLLFPLCR